MILFAPTDWEIGVTVQMCTAGIPAASIVFTIVAPQRVHVPQVDVSITPSTSASRNCFAISVPKVFALSVGIAVPVVT